MEKYARQAIAEGCKHAEDLVVNADSELYRVLNLHYNRNNQIDVSSSHIKKVFFRFEGLDRVICPYFILIGE